MVYCSTCSDFSVSKIWNCEKIRRNFCIRMPHAGSFANETTKRCKMYTKSRSRQLVYSLHIFLWAFWVGIFGRTKSLVQLAIGNVCCVCFTSGTAHNRYRLVSKLPVGREFLCKNTRRRLLWHRGNKAFIAHGEWRQKLRLKTLWSRRSTSTFNWSVRYIYISLFVFGSRIGST